MGESGLSLRRIVENLTKYLIVMHSFIDADVSHEELNVV